MTSSVRILTCDSPDSSPSIVLTSPAGKGSVLVNCGEGCQRSFLERPGLRVRSINKIAVCRVGHAEVGGLPGMILTSSDAAGVALTNVKSKKSRKFPTVAINEGTSKRGRWKAPRSDNDSCTTSTDATEGIQIIGPEGIGTFVHSLRHFMRRERFPIAVREGEYRSTCSNGGSHLGTGKKNKRKKSTSDGSRGDPDDDGFAIQTIPMTYVISNNDAPGNCGEGVAETKMQHRSKSDKSLQISTRVKIASFIFTTPRIPGKFRVDRAKALGIPPGPLYAQLKSGRSVTFSTVEKGSNKVDKTVHSHEVVEKGCAGVATAVIFCPSIDVLRDLRTSPHLTKFVVGVCPDSSHQPERNATDPAARTNDAHSIQKQSTNGNSVNGQDDDAVALECMVHIAPLEIARHHSYREWLISFGVQTQHIVLPTNGYSEATPFHSAWRGAVSRNFIHDGIFPLPPIPSDRAPSSVNSCNPVTGKCISDRCTTGEELIWGDNVIRGRPSMEFTLVPRSKKGIHQPEVRPLWGVSVEEQEELRRDATNLGALELASSIVVSAASDGGKSGESEQLAELVFTGTGSAIPCKHRNVTGMYLRMANGNAMMLDVGEGTIGQLMRAWTNQNGDGFGYRATGTQSRLREIRAVWISHPHADHHLGLLRLLSERHSLFPREPLVLMAPVSLLSFLEEYCNVDPTIRGSYIGVDARDMICGRANPLASKLRDDLGISDCFCVPVSHCAHSFGVVIDGTSFGRVVYSGDCRPSDRLAKAGRGADLLIHEATFEDGMEEDAVLKRHSTVGEALLVQKKMGARRCVLTHFSQRYPKIPPLQINRRDEESTQGKAGERSHVKDLPCNINSSVIFAFDFMTLRPENLDLASSLTPALRLLYPENQPKSEAPETFSSSASEVLSVPGIFAREGVL